MDAIYADLVILNGDVVTVNPRQPKVEAVATKWDRIVKVGSADELKELIGPETEGIDLKGRALLPGFIDTHQHLISRSVFKYGPFIDLSPSHSIAEALEIVKKKVEKVPKGEWIVGRGFRGFVGSYVEGRRPTRWDLDKVTPDNPCYFRELNGDYQWFNSKAIELSGINKDTAVPGGRGILFKDAETGELTGLGGGTSRQFFLKLIKNPSREELVEICRRGCTEAVANGYTTIHHIMIPWFEGKMYDVMENIAFLDLYERAELPLRVVLYVHAYKEWGVPTDHQLLDRIIDAGIRSGFGDNMVKLGGIKVVGDGVAGDSEEWRPLYTQDEMDGIVLKANRAKLQMAVHAYITPTINIVLSSYEKALKEAPWDARHRIEHANIMDDKIIERVAKLGVSIFGGANMDRSTGDLVPVPKDQDMLKRRYKTAMKRGVNIHSGTDCHPFEDANYNPLSRISDLVVYGPSTLSEERYTVEEAIRTWTINGAYAVHEEKIKGTIEVGKLADFVVLSDNPLCVPPERIKDIRVERTIVGGKTVYKGR